MSQSRIHFRYVVQTTYTHTACKPTVGSYGRSAGSAEYLPEKMTYQVITPHSSLTLPIVVKRLRINLVFNERAHHLSELLVLLMGREVGVDGRLQNTKDQNQNCEKGSATNFNGNKVTFQSVQDVRDIITSWNVFVSHCVVALYLTASPRLPRNRGIRLNNTKQTG